MHHDDREMSALGPVTDRPVSIPIPLRQRRSVGCFTYPPWLNTCLQVASPEWAGLAVGHDSQVVDLYRAPHRRGRSRRRRVRSNPRGRQTGQVAGRAREQAHHFKRTAVGHEELPLPLPVGPNARGTPVPRAPTPE